MTSWMGYNYEIAFWKWGNICPFGEVCGRRKRPKRRRGWLVVDWWGSVGTKLHEDDRDVHMECFVSPHKLFSPFSFL